MNESLSTRKLQAGVEPAKAHPYVAGAWDHGLGEQRQGAGTCGGAGGALAASRMESHHDAGQGAWGLAGILVSGGQKAVARSC